VIESAGGTVRVPVTTPPRPLLFSDLGPLVAPIATPAVEDDLRPRTAPALALRVRGVPTLAVGDRLLYGDDRLDEAA
jgi:hypothetical protein